jgi:hypothetical protein
MTMSVAITDGGGSQLAEVKFDWTSASDGTASGMTSVAYTGQLLRAVFDPGASASQPTDAYDVVITDKYGADMLAGAGANLSNAANVYKSQSDGLSCMDNSKLTLSVSNAGDTKSGSVIIYILLLDIRNRPA